MFVLKWSTTRAGETKTHISEWLKQLSSRMQFVQKYNRGFS